MSGIGGHVVDLVAELAEEPAATGCCSRKVTNLGTSLKAPRRDEGRVVLRLPRRPGWRAGLPLVTEGVNRLQHCTAWHAVAIALKAHDSEGLTSDAA